MKNFFLFKVCSISLLLLCSNSSIGQGNDTTQIIKNKYVLSLIPTRSPNSYGVQLGLIGSEAICGYPYYKNSSGINIQLFGQGVLWMFYPVVIKQNQLENNKKDPLDTLIKYDRLRAVHNGVLLSTFGAIDTKVNGITLSLFYGQGSIINGLAFNLIRNQFNFVHGVEMGLINESKNLKGMQIGLINSTKKLKGFQIGLWNVNENRSLPIVNWNFKNKSP